MLEAIFQEDTVWRVIGAEVILKSAQDDGVMRTLGIASALLATYAFVPYVRDVLARRTEPQKACWLIWSVLSSIALASQVAEGGTDSVWFSAIQVVGTVTVFLISLRHGGGPMMRAGDGFVLWLASLGLVLWAWTDNSVYALIISIAISMLGGWVTIKKAYYYPESETLSTWVMSCVAAALAILAIGSVDIVLMAYPLYLFTLYALIVGAITLGRARAARGTVPMVHP